MVSVADSAGLSGWHATPSGMERETVENDHGRYVHLYTFAAAPEEEND